MATQERLTAATDTVAKQKRAVRELEVELDKVRTSAEHTVGALRAELASTEDQLFEVCVVVVACVYVCACLWAGGTRETGRESTTREEPD